MSLPAELKREKSPVIGRLLLDVTQRLRRSRTLALLREIEHAPYVAASEVRAHQFERLSALLAHAEARVPYYREMFRALGITSRDVRSLGDFAGLPVLTKQIVRERQRDLIREDVSPEKLLPHHSGGSTGVPLTFYRDRAYLDASEAGTFRAMRQAGWQPGEMVAFFWGGNERLYGMATWQFELRQKLRRMYQFDPFRSGAAEMNAWLERWPGLSARVALGYASTIARFAAHIEATGARVAPLRGVFTTAEKLYRPQREIISRVFGCHVYDCYGSSEVQNIAAECPRGSMHVNADYVVLESEREAATASAATAGAETEAGGGGDANTAPFIITSLWNYSMPFIRYRNEDCGELIDGGCDCGNNFPLMRLNIGRVSDNFILPGGRVVHGEFFTHLMYGSEGIANFQFHQTAPDAITIWIVPLAGVAAGAREPALRAAVEQIKALAPERDVNVEVRETESIPLSKAGKHRFTRSDVREAGGAAAAMTTGATSPAPDGRG